ncbi:carbohydrate ABC transporter permease [Microlunatus sp. Gsoil 973]|uniref:carbohydrate ABC transporter permease n=1 Tax=Microlunatus sp. Gsoil 973 TaxID=2672569 RepID=UPI0012B47261|nr:sugar ABC transporter permease [Microlunatus sp. Gsoil 973]QGN32750.1 ABC transporter permease subunit [Microlunatus sp. Gsoil 973]
MTSVGAASEVLGATDRRSDASATRPTAPWRRRDRRIGLAAVAPAFVIVVGFMIYPVLYALFISFNKTDGVDFEWVWLKNYGNILTDPLVHQVFLNNIKFLVSVPLVIFFSIIVSVLLFEKIRGWKTFRIIFFLPNVLSIVVIGVMFKSIFGYYGAVNGIIAALGGTRISFFTDGSLAIWVIVIALVWSGFGYQALLIMSGLSAIDTTVFEAAALDGAGWWRRLWRITLPNIRRELGFVFIINVLYTFTSLFGFIFVMTAGGPGYATTTVDYLVYLKAFGSENLGPGAALAVLLFIFIGLLTVLQNRVFRIQDND